MPALETLEALTALPNDRYDPVTITVEKHPWALAHPHLQMNLQVMLSSLLEGDYPPQMATLFRPFASINDYIFADEHIRAHLSTKLINRLLSTYPTGHLTFQNHKDVFGIVD